MTKKDQKLIVLGLDGMDPSMVKKFMAEGIMPNTKRFLEHASYRDDLVMLGGHPTITPPMWTTISTGAYANTHGITDFYANNDEDIIGVFNNFDSTKCRAEQLWNVTAEAGYKTLVWTWPGSSWPPTSDNPNLMVVDGTTPETLNAGVASVDGEMVLVASPEVAAPTFRARSASDSHIPCMVNELEPINLFGRDVAVKGKSSKPGCITSIIVVPEDGEGGVAKMPFDVVLSPIKEPSGWQKMPQNAKEVTFLFSKGLIRRPALILQNDNGIYDRVAVFENKKSDIPLYILHNNKFERYVKDTAIINDQKYENVVRNMRILTLNEDGSYLKVWISGAMDSSNDTRFYPKELHKKILDHVGNFAPHSFVGGGDEQLIKDCCWENWNCVIDLYDKALHYMIDEENVEVIFSHMHSIDLQGHMIVTFLKDKENSPTTLGEKKYWELFRLTYQQADDYIGRFIHLIDEGWDMIILSDHGQLCRDYDRPLLSDPMGVAIPIMRDLGFTVMLKDENGQDTYNIDWSKTKAIANRSCSIYLNLKGRTDHGIVDPEDQWELEEEIITALYGYRSPETGRRVVSVALRNKDAVLLGYGGEGCGDICFFMTDGYTLQHGDCLSTAYGYGGTSVSPVFMASGPDFKDNYITTRVIRQVDVAPTIATILEVRMPAQCEGAPIYQILK